MTDYALRRLPRCARNARMPIAKIFFAANDFTFRETKCFGNFSSPSFLPLPLYRCLSILCLLLPHMVARRPPLDKGQHLSNASSLFVVSPSIGRAILMSILVRCNEKTLLRRRGIFSGIFSCRKEDRGSTMQWAHN